MEFYSVSDEEKTQNTHKEEIDYKRLRIRIHEIFQLLQWSATNGTKSSQLQFST